jgi:hypothetical protein
VDRVLARTGLTPRESAFWALIDASHERTPAARRDLVLGAQEALSPDEIYHATTVIALFNYYNAFVDLNGVDSLPPAGYEATGLRLSTQGYAPQRR